MAITTFEVEKINGKLRSGSYGCTVDGEDSVTADVVKTSISLPQLSAGTQTDSSNYYSQESLTNDFQIVLNGTCVVGTQMGVHLSFPAGRYYIAIKSYKTT